MKADLEGGEEGQPIKPDLKFNGYSVETLKWERVLASDLQKLEKLGGINSVAQALETHLTKGLSTAASQDQKRLDVFGTNIYEKPPLRHFCSHCWEQLQDPMLIILIIAGLIAVVVGSIHHPEDGWIEGLAIQFAVVIVVNVGAFNNWSQERAFRAQEDKKEEPKITVFRNGELKVMFHHEVVVGDLVNLKSGDTIPADGLVYTSDDLEINEATMTGESCYIKKHPTKDPFLRAATEVKKGTATVIITATGSNSSYGEIMKMLAVEPEETALQAKLERLATLIGYVGTGVAVVLFIALMIFWIVDCDSGQKDWGEDSDEILEYFIVAITIIVVAVPEGLPLAVTVALAYSMDAMQEDNNLVKVLSACETMGNVTTICSDKTGTLTTGKMTVVREYVEGKSRSEPVKSEEWKTLFTEAIILGSSVVYEKDKHDPNEPPENWNWVNGNQTEACMLAFIVRCYGVDIDQVREARRADIVKLFPFDSTVKRSGVLMKLKNGKYRLYTRGAAERILAECTRQFVDGNEKALDKAFVETHMNEMSNSGLRAIGVSYRDFDELEKNEEGKVADPPNVTDRVLMTILGMQDPLRHDCAESVRLCQGAGVVVRMVTGDHLNTAKYIARDCGILTNDDQIAMEGIKFRTMLDKDKEALVKMIPMLRVLARSQPEDKQKLIRLLQELGEVVGATGDGTNDAAALKAANVGLAMNKSGTEMAKRAADVVILDDSFSSIVMSVKWGRAIYDNISKFVQFQVTVNVVALVLSLVGALAGFSVPLTAVQLLWVNMIMDTFAALALATEKPTDVLLKRRPFGKDAFLIRPVMWRFILGQSAYQLTILFILLFAGERMLDFESQSTQHYTTIFNTFVFMQIFNEINARKVCGEINVFDGFFTNNLFLAIICGTAAAQVIIVELAGPFASTAPIDGMCWLVSVLLGLGGIPWAFGLHFIPVDLEHGQIPENPDLVLGLKQFKARGGKTLNHHCSPKEADLKEMKAVVWDEKKSQNGENIPFNVESPKTESDYKKSIGGDL